MNYPMICVRDPWIGETYREMTPDEYESQLEWFRQYAEKEKNATSRRTQDYVSYLNRWFSDGTCDGAPDFKTRYTWRKLPMSKNEYLFG